MKKFLKSILNGIVFVFTHRGETARKSVNENLCDFSGQGRNKYGE